MASKYSIRDLVAFANGNSQNEEQIKWSNLINDLDLQKLTEYCWAHQTELEYVLVPYFVMSSAVTGKKTTIECGMTKPGRSNLYLLMCGNPASGKSCGFELVVNNSKAAIEKELGSCPISNDLSRTALLYELQKQTKEDLPFLVLASDEMGLSLNGEARDTKEFEQRRLIYNNSFSGTDISSERMLGSIKINEVKILNPHLSIIGMTQPTPLFVWIKNVASNDDGLLERFLIWVVAHSSKQVIPKKNVQIPLNWPTECLLMLTKYHKLNTKEYHVTFDVYKKVCEVESRATRLREEEWQQFLQLLKDGKEADAAHFRRNMSVPTIRHSELVLRFALGLHVGLHALEQFLNGKQIGEIPDMIKEETINFAVAAVQRCIKQTDHFRNQANRLSSKQSMSLPHSSTVEHAKPYNLRNITTDSPKQESYVNADHDVPDKGGLNKLLLNVKYRNLLRKIVQFPAPYLVPKVIYRYTNGIHAADVQRIFHAISQTHRQSNEGYFGKLLEVKSLVTSRRSYTVLFRAPYTMTDNQLLKMYNINNEQEYKKLLAATIGGPNCTLRKAIEHRKGNWYDFIEACEKNKPSFDE